MKTKDMEIGQKIVLASIGSSGWHRTHYKQLEVTRKSPTGIVTAKSSDYTATIQPSGHVSMKFNVTGHVDKRWRISSQEALDNDRVQRKHELRQRQLQDWVAALGQRIRYMDADTLDQVAQILGQLGEVK